MPLGNTLNTPEYMHYHYIFYNLYWSDGPAIFLTAFSNFLPCMNEKSFYKLSKKYGSCEDVSLFSLSTVREVS
jgi:hypothetical protein